MIHRRSLLVAATLALGFAGNLARADALSNIQSSGTLRVAVPQDFPPFGSVGTDMTPQGYDIDVAKLIAGEMGVDLELVPVTSANRIPYLQTGKVDLVISSMGKNPERDAVIDFSMAYAPFYNGVFAPEDIAIEGPDDLAGKVVGVTRGSIEDLELSEIAPTEATLRRYEDNNGTIQAFLSGQVEAIATGNVVAAAILERNPPQRPEMKFLVKDSPCYIGLNENEPALMEALDAILAAAKTDGRLDAISQQWLGMPLPEGL
ncbi:polar amino acid transport system substrate-binding protein [Limimaricola variabilis]|uniref:Polar amino acid transport system substrate-binding protein n=1 Tax=Limimaricola variabilis TaxID=1492771 RepID=A0ABR6HR06_9RHOB|nr:transporter substrate-binding domain-containing protein [Limimaricola variabilis]MBB3712987.1 polar amino acid transport system substrate-binding protein [Limimaricola variabilis]